MVNASGMTSEAVLDAFLACCLARLRRPPVTFPNPTQGDLFLRSLSPIHSALDVVVTDMHGRVMRTINLKNLVRDEKIETSGMSAGIYFVSVHTEFGSTMFKIVLE